MTPPYRTTRDRLPVAARFGVPVWSASSIIFASLVTGALLSLNFKELGSIFFWCFAIGGIASVLLVEPRGLFLTTVQLPIAFGIATPLTAWAIGRSLPGANESVSSAEIVTAIFPLAERFPFLMSVTIVAVILALIRWLIARAAQARAVKQRAVQRQQVRRVNREKAEQAIRARSAVRTHRARGARPRQVTVQELMRQRQSSSRPDDLYN